MLNNQNNPNNPYNLQSTWNPFTGEWTPSQPQQLQGFVSYAQPPPYTPVYNPQPTKPPPQMSPEDYAQFQMWRQSQQQQPDVHSVEETNPTPESSRKTKGKKSKKDSPAKTKKVVPNRNIWTPEDESRKPKSQKTNSSCSVGSSRASLDESLATTFEGIRSDKQGYYKTKDLEAKLRILSMPTEHLPDQARFILEMEKMKICESMGWPYSTGATGGAGGSGSGN